MFSICNNHDDKSLESSHTNNGKDGKEKETKGEKMAERKWKLLGNGQGLTHFGS